MALNDSLDISYQTIYAELAQRSLDETFASEFSSNGRFVAVDVKGKKYWYFDTLRRAAVIRNVDTWGRPTTRRSLEGSRLSRI